MIPANKDDPNPAIDLFVCDLSSAYRENLVTIWMGTVKTLNLPFSDDFSFSDFLAKPTDVRDWIIKGLPRYLLLPHHCYPITASFLLPRHYLISEAVTSSPPAARRTVLG